MNQKPSFKQIPESVSHSLTADRRHISGDYPQGADFASLPRRPINFAWLQRKIVDKM